MTTRELTKDEATSAEAIQSAIDGLGLEGGRVVLPAMELTLDRGLELRSGVELVGQGDDTLLRKGPGRVYPLSGYHNYGMCDAPLQSTQGLGTGMTVCVLDELRRGFYETFARITWIDGDWVGLSQGIKGDYYANETPRLVTAFPLVFGHGIADAALRNVRLEGNRAEQEEGIGGCRGGSVYFAASRRIEVTDVKERDFFGEGLGFQMCRDMRIIDCAFDSNTGNGLHPGAGSTNCLFESCSAAGNGRSGFFFCVRANHITVTGCSFENNVVGVSVGIRDCNNVVDACRVAGNRGDGVLFREDGVAPGEVHSVRVSHCDIKENALVEGEAQVSLRADAHDIVLEDNRIRGVSGRTMPAIHSAPTVRNLYCNDNAIEDCEIDVSAAAESLIPEKPDIRGGYGTAPETAFRHLTQVHI